MSNVELLKNPVLRNKMGMDIINPSGNVMEEISEQDMNLQIGGTASIFTIYTIGTLFVSKPFGNKGYYCTLTKECQNMCQ